MFDEIIEQAEQAASTIRGLSLFDLMQHLPPLDRLTLPPEVRAKQRASQRRTRTEKAVIAKAPEIGYKLAPQIPRLEAVAAIIRHHRRLFEEPAGPKDETAREELPLGARILKVVADLVQLETTGIARSVALRTLRTREGWYDSVVLDAATRIFAPADARDAAPAGDVVEAALSDLRDGDRLLASVKTQAGRVLLTSGRTLSHAFLVQLWNYAKLAPINEPVRVERARGREPFPAEGAPS